MTNEIIAKKTAPIDWTSIKKEVTRRIVASVSPQRVLLFGSAVNGKLSADSDLDILVIMRGVVHRRQTAQKIYRDLQGVGAPVDVVVVTEEDIADYGDKPGTILRPALSEGQVLYDAH
jgi:predicted nucleotidyltransferase